MTRTLRLTAALVASLALLAPALAADGELRAEVKAPASVTPGRLVRLEATLVRERDALREEASSTADAAGSPKFAWRLVSPPAGYDVADWTFDGGRTVVFAAAEPGAYRFVLAAALPGPSGGPPTLLLAGHTLVVTGPAPQPTPTPTPQPAPDPLPDGRFGLAKATHDLVLAQVPAGDRPLAGTLAGNYRAVASRVAAGTLTAPDQILVATAEGNRDALAPVPRPGGPSSRPWPTP
jgi:hypothetical protein